MDEGVDVGVWDGYSRCRVVGIGGEKGRGRLGVVDERERDNWIMG